MRDHSMPPEKSKQKPVSPMRRRFLELLVRDQIQEKARPHYERWAEQWLKARGHESVERSKV
ncbi:MAG: hypothetical protein R3242_05845 [Akkermansiaceae bacterium]|nr:hypothetical protein [Akkermansiaceae bacterium]